MRVASWPSTRPSTPAEPHAVERRAGTAPHSPLAHLASRSAHASQTVDLVVDRDVLLLDLAALSHRLQEHDTVDLGHLVPGALATLAGVEDSHGLHPLSISSCRRMEIGRVLCGHESCIGFRGHSAPPFWKVGWVE